MWIWSCYGFTGSTSEDSWSLWNVLGSARMVNSKWTYVDWIDHKLHLSGHSFDFDPMQILVLTNIFCSHSSHCWSLKYSWVWSQWLWTAQAAMWAACCRVLSAFPKQPVQISNTSQLGTKIVKTQLRLYLNPIDQTNKVFDVTDIQRDRMGPSSLHPWKERLSVLFQNLCHAWITRLKF